MAFLPHQDPNQQQQDGQQGDQNQIPAVPQIPTLQGSSGPAGGTGAGTGATNTASPGAAPTSPWQNITTYLNANAGQAGNVAGTIAGNLTDQYNSANQAIGQAQQNFGQQIEGARAPLNKGLVDQAAASPGKFTQNPQNVTDFQKMFNASYGGPQDFSHSQDYSDLQSKVQGAQKQAALVNQGTPGLMTLLQQAESKGGKNPSQGVTALDSLLLQEDPSNFSKLSAAQAPFSGLTDYLSQTQKGLDTSAQNAAKEAADTQAAVQGQFLGPNGVVPTFQNTLNQNMQSASDKAKGYNTQITGIIDKLNSGKPLTPQESSLIDPSGTLQTLNPYGSGGGVFANMLAMGFPGVAPGVLSQFYDHPDLIMPPSIENVMTPQQQADAQALNQLTGQNALSVPENLGQPFALPQSSGTFQDHNAIQSLYDILKNDESALPMMSPQQQSSYQSDLQALMSYLGMPSPYQGPPIQPTVPDQQGLGEGGGPPFLQPLTVNTGTTRTSGGGRAFR